jgi:hypothetical protein
VVEQGEARPFRHAGQHCPDDLVWRGYRERDRHRHDLRAGSARRELEGVAAGVVLVVGGQQLVARGEGHDCSTALTAVVALLTHTS